MKDFKENFKGAVISLSFVPLVVVGVKIVKVELPDREGVTPGYEPTLTAMGEKIGIIKVAADQIEKEMRSWPLL